MLQDIDWVGLSKLDEIGVPQAVGSTLDEYGTSVATRRLITVPEGQCFIATQVGGYSLQAGGVGGTPGVSPPIADRPATGIDLGDRAGAAAGGILAMPFYRWQSLFNASAAATWRNAHPSQTWMWRPKHPICIPSGWFMNNAQTNLYGNGSIVRGYLIDARAAATMGFDTNTSAATRRQRVAGAIATSGGAVLIPARAGQSVQIQDIFVRVQPLATGAANILTIRQTDAKVIFEFINDNPANLCEAQLSPGLFTKAGQGVNIICTTTGAASVSVVYRYVDAADVPANHWWSQIDPTVPGTSATAVGGAVAGFRAATAFAAYYPAKDITVASGLSGAANQNILKGYSITASHTATTQTSFFRLGTGATGGYPGFTIGGAGWNNVGTPVSAVQTLYSQEQTVWENESAISIKSKTGEGFFFEATGLAVGATADASIRNWSCTAWGFTVPALDRVGTRVRGTAS